MGLFGVAPLVRRWMKYWAVVEMASPRLRMVVSMEIDSPQTKFFWVTRNNVVAQASRMVWSGASPGITLAALWNCISWNRNWVVRLWEPIFVYSQNRRQKNRPICMRSAVH